jgi:hypothetical protein
MRTPYKVHLNFPDIWVVEEIAGAVRKRVINRCRVELSGLPPLDMLREEQKRQQQVRRAADLAPASHDDTPRTVRLPWRVTPAVLYLQLWTSSWTWW